MEKILSIKIYIKLCKMKAKKIKMKREVLELKKKNERKEKFKDHMGTKRPSRVKVMLVAILQTFSCKLLFLYYYLTEERKQ